MRQRLFVPASWNRRLPCTFVVVEVDKELRLYRDGFEILSATSRDNGVSCSLLLSANYLIRYNNNDGGAGILHFQIQQDGAVLSEVNRRAISGATVHEIDFALVAQRA